MAILNLEEEITLEEEQERALQEQMDIGKWFAVNLNREPLTVSAKFSVQLCQTS